MVSPMARQFKHLRTGVYWFRQRVPEDVRALVGRKEASGLSRASAARRAIRHRCWRQGLRAGLQAPPQARPRHRPATRRPQGRHVGASPARSRPPPRQAPGNAAHDTGRPQTPPRQQGLPQRPLRLHHAPRRAADQQRLRTGAATLRDLPQGHRRLPLPMGSACLRRSLYRHRHRKAQPHICPPGHLKRPETVPGLTPTQLGPEQLLAARRSKTAFRSSRNVTARAGLSAAIQFQISSRSIWAPGVRSYRLTRVSARERVLSPAVPP